MAGYHVAHIRRGTYGELSKIVEEVEELQDAVRQGNPVMALCELSDLVGAIKGYLKNKHPSISFDQLIKMQEATSRVHEAGLWQDRNPKPPCKHEHVREAGFRMPLSHGSAKVEVCTDCWSWQFYLHGWSGWIAPEKLPEKLLEDEDR